jgi:6-pyruvoyltetrahydropterin/6-carboxytetrahydropterin synthase
MIRVTRRYRFSASHRLHAERLSDAANHELYGKCNNPYGHGHDYVLEISVRGPVDPESGRAADLPALDRLVESRILRAFDHKDLNTDVPEFAAAVPTTENLALEIRRRLREGWTTAFPGVWPRLEKVRVCETRRNAFEITEKI